MTVLAAYTALIAAGELRPDPEQLTAATRLDALATELEHPKKRGLFRRRAVPARGVYLWGGVGRGKSMLMDLFFANVAIDRLFSLTRLPARIDGFLRRLKPKTRKAKLAEARAAEGAQTRES